MWKRECGLKQQMKTAAFFQVLPVDTQCRCWRVTQSRALSMCNIAILYKNTSVSVKLKLGFFPSCTWNDLVQAVSQHGQMIQSQGGKPWFITRIVNSRPGKSPGLLCITFRCKVHWIFQYTQCTPGKGLSLECLCAFVIIILRTLVWFWKVQNCRTWRWYHNSPHFRKQPSQSIHLILHGLFFNHAYSP